MMRGKLSIEAVEGIRKCNSEEEVFEKLKEFEPDCEEKDAEILYRMLVLGEENSEDLNGGSFFDFKFDPSWCKVNFPDPKPFNLVDYLENCEVFPDKPYVMPEGLFDDKDNPS